MDVPQIESLLETLREEHTTLGTAIASMERLLALRRNVEAHSTAIEQQSFPGTGNGVNPSAPKGSISLRKAIGEVLRESGKPLHVKQILQLVYAKGARTSAKKPLGIIALSAGNIDGVQKVAPRTFQWK